MTLLRAAWEAVQRGAERRKGGQRGEREEGERGEVRGGNQIVAGSLSSAKKVLAFSSFLLP